MYSQPEASRNSEETGDSSAQGGVSLHAETNQENPGGFRHIPALDGIRGAAILMVLAHHLLWSNGNTGSRMMDLFAEIRESLWIGVNLFFALSGFLITGILRDTLHKPNFFRNFYVRRSLRIFPLYYGVLIVLLLLTPVFHYNWHQWQYFFLTYTSNIAVPMWSHPDPQIGSISISHFWSLQVEEQFYLLWPLLIFRFRKIKTIFTVAMVGWVSILLFRIAMAKLYWPFSNPYLLYSPTFSCADDILIGCMLALAVRSHHRERTLAAAPKVFAFSTAILIALALYLHSFSFLTSRAVSTVGISLLGIAFTSMIAMSLRAGSRTERLFATPVLRFFGRYSYGLYMFHTFLGRFWLWVRLWLNLHFHSKMLAVAGSAVATASLSVLIALLSYHLYEVHFLKLKRFFSYKFAKTPLQEA